MAEYLEQDLMNERGYVARQGHPKPTQAAVALLGAPDGRVVFGDPKTARATYARAGGRLIHYDDEVERQRRLVCDTALGQLMLDNPKFAKPAVESVSAGIDLYWRGLKGRLALQPTSSGDPFRKIVETDGKYVSNPTSFGRLPVKEPPKSELDRFKAKIDIWLATLQGTDLPQIMTLHDTFLKIHCSNEPGAPKPMELAAQLGLREEWYDKTERGRLNRDRDRYGASMLPGLITDDFTIPFGDSLQRAGVDPDTMRVEKRNRGTDMFAIQASVMRPAFREMLGLHNLVFAASASGTTSTLLASANTFRPGILKNAESLKQYLMACVAYLVGGGMHTCHEVFYTGGLAGLKYATGKYLDMLPATFTGSRLYERWSDEYWDIVRPDRPSPR